MSIEKPRNEGSYDDTHNLHRPPSRDYRDQPGYRRKQRITATIIFWLLWVSIGVVIAALDASLILHRPDNIDTPLGWAQLLAASMTLVLGTGGVVGLLTWSNRNRYK